MQLDAPSWRPLTTQAEASFRSVATKLTLPNGTFSPLSPGKVAELRAEAARGVAALAAAATATDRAAATGMFSSMFDQSVAKARATAASIDALTGADLLDINNVRMAAAFTADNLVVLLQMTQGLAG